MNPAREPPTVWVMHAGALGDWVLVWPLLRALGRGGARVIAVCHAEKAKLAAAWIECSPGSIIALPGGIDQPGLSRWWSGPTDRQQTGGRGDWSAVSPDQLISFLCDDSTPAGRAWLAAAAAEFPHATIATIGAPGSASRAALWQREHVEACSAVTPRSNRNGPIVCHIGAGSEDKRWPLARWAGLIGGLRAQGRAVEALAGEVERERLTTDDRATFDRLGGRILGSLEQLAAETAAAGLFIGADTGPTHLAAQLGVPTLALFGPTDPAVWAPVGPAVRVLKPATPRRMDWLPVEAVASAAKSPGEYTSPP